MQLVRTFRQLFLSPMNGNIGRSVRAQMLTLIPVASILFAFGAAHAQDTAPDVLTVQSRLVQLDVTVLDKSGAPITDLKADDFTLYENGQPQRIRNFEAYNDHQLPPIALTQGITGTPDLQRIAPDAPVTILVLDEFNTAFEDTAFARIQLRKYLEHQPLRLTQPTSFLVATDAGFEQVQDYTLDRNLLLAALAKLPPAYPAEMMRTGGSPEGIAIRFAQTLASLQQIAQASEGHKGRKNVVWLGRGFDSLDLRNEPDYQVRLVKGAAERAVNLLRDAHVTVYTIDPTLSTTIASELNLQDSQTDTKAFLAETHNRQDPFSDTISFNTMAPETGGRAFALNNGLASEISSAVQEGSGYYSLTYVPSGDVDPKDPYRRITVRVDRPNVSVVTRQGYFAIVPPLPHASEKQQLRSAGFDLGTAISSHMQYTGLGVLAGASATDPALYIVQVNTNDLTWQRQPDGAQAAHVILVAVGINTKGKPVSKNVKDVVAKLAPQFSPAEIPLTTLRIALPSQPGISRVRIAVRDQADGRLGTADVMGR